MTVSGVWAGFALGQKKSMSLRQADVLIVAGTLSATHHFS
jgi:NADH:ubiquinone oxidoreductase subunit B-like Fe-S oxidoreductase